MAWRVGTCAWKWVWLSLPAGVTDAEMLRGSAILRDGGEKTKEVIGKRHEEEL
jgi:hypothetical protein